MKTLALDTGSPFACAAITEDGQLLAKTVLRGGTAHSEILLPAVENLLRSLGLSPADMDLFALSAGPGSFTGVRIGAATLKGLAFGLAKPCIALSSLEVLAENLRGLEGIFCPVMDARRSRMYNALFEGKNGKISRLTPDRVLPVDELEEELRKDCAEKPIFLCGDGAKLTEELFRELHPAFTPPLLRLPDAASAARLAEAKYLVASAEERAKLTDSALAPVYLRPSQAEQERTEASARLGI